MPHNITIYTDGAASGNPGPGGYGVVLMAGAHRKELSEGFRRTTNNRMELLAVIIGRYNSAYRSHPKSDQKNPMGDFEQNPAHTT